MGKRGVSLMPDPSERARGRVARSIWAHGALSQRPRSRRRGRSLRTSVQPGCRLTSSSVVRRDLRVGVSRSTCVWPVRLNGRPIDYTQIAAVSL